jgi:hypothetical protein
MRAEEAMTQAKFIASTPNSAFGDSQWKSPFDTCPASSIDMYNNDVGKKSAQKFMK